MGRANKSLKNKDTRGVMGMRGVFDLSMKEVRPTPTKRSAIPVENMVTWKLPVPIGTKESDVQERPGPVNTSHGAEHRKKTLPVKRSDPQSSSVDPPIARGSQGLSASLNEGPSISGAGGFPCETSILASGARANNHAAFVPHEPSTIDNSSSTCQQQSSPFTFITGPSNNDMVLPSTLDITSALTSVPPQLTAEPPSVPQAVNNVNYPHSYIFHNSEVVSVFQDLSHSGCSHNGTVDLYTMAICRCCRHYNIINPTASNTTEQQHVLVEDDHRASLLSSFQNSCLLSPFIRVEEEFQSANNAGHMGFNPSGYVTEDDRAYNDGFELEENVKASTYTNSLHLQQKPQVPTLQIPVQPYRGPSSAFSSIPSSTTTPADQHLSALSPCSASSELPFTSFRNQFSLS